MDRREGDTNTSSHLLFKATPAWWSSSFTDNEKKEKNKQEIIENNVDKLPKNVQSFRGNEILAGLERRAVEMKNGRKPRKNQITPLNMLCFFPILSLTGMLHY